MEIWKKLNEIPDLEWLVDYEVSSYGRVKSFKYDKEKGQILKLDWRTGYLTKCFKHPVTKKTHKFSIHRLVMMAFKYINNYKEMTVDHIDENTLNNRLSNLQWMTAGDNIRKSQAKSKTFIDSDKIAKEYLDNPDVKLIELAEKYSCSIETIWRTINKYSTLDNNKKRKTFSKWLRKKIAEYRLSGYTLKETGKKFNCCESQVSYIVKQYKRGEFNELS